MPPKKRGSLLPFAKAVVKSTLPDRLVAHLQAADHYFRGEPEIRLLRFLCRPGALAVDVGANIGTYTYFMRRRGSSVRAYEPNPDLAKRLQRLYPDIIVRQVALSDRRGVLRLRLPIVDGRPQCELASVSQAFSEETVDYDVPSVPLDDEELTNVGFIKIDVEQHEVAVLQGALATIRRCRPDIMTETTPLLYPRPLPEHFAFVTEMDYVGWFRFHGRFRSFSAFDSAMHADPAQFGKRFVGSNVVFRPKECRAAGPFGRS
jgi:FkbM family methyltransferase